MHKIEQVYNINQKFAFFTQRIVLKDVLPNPEKLKPFKEQNFKKAFIFKQN